MADPPRSTISTGRTLASPSRSTISTGRTLTGARAANPNIANIQLADRSGSQGAPKSVFGQLAELAHPGKMLIGLGNFAGGIATDLANNAIDPVGTLSGLANTLGAPIPATSRRWSLLGVADAGLGAIGRPDIIDSSGQYRPESVAELARSFARTVRDVGDAAYAVGNRRDDYGLADTEYGRASRDGRIVAKLVEDIGNAAVVGAAAGKIAGAGATAAARGAAAEGVSAARAAQLAQRAARLESAAGKIRRASLVADRGAARTIFWPEQVATKVGRSLTRPAGRAVPESFGRVARAADRVLNPVGNRLRIPQGIEAARTRALFTPEGQPRRLQAKLDARGGRALVFEGSQEADHHRAMMNQAWSAVDRKGISPMEQTAYEIYKSGVDRAWTPDLEDGFGTTVRPRLVAAREAREAAWNQERAAWLEETGEDIGRFNEPPVPDTLAGLLEVKLGLRSVAEGPLAMARSWRDGGVPDWFGDVDRIMDERVFRPARERHLDPSEGRRQPRTWEQQRNAQEQLREDLLSTPMERAAETGDRLVRAAEVRLEAAADDVKRAEQRAEQARAGMVPEATGRDIQMNRAADRAEGGRQTLFRLAASKGDDAAALAARLEEIDIPDIGEPRVAGQTRSAMASGRKAGTAESRLRQVETEHTQIRADVEAKHRRQIAEDRVFDGDVHPDIAQQIARDLRDQLKTAADNEFRALELDIQAFEDSAHGIPILPAAKFDKATGRWYWDHPSVRNSDLWTWDAIGNPAEAATRQRIAKLRKRYGQGTGKWDEYASDSGRWAGLSDQDVIRQFMDVAERLDELRFARQRGIGANISQIDGFNQLPDSYQELLELANSSEYPTLRELADALVEDSLDRNPTMLEDIAGEAADAADADFLDLQSIVEDELANPIEGNPTARFDVLDQADKRIYRNLMRQVELHRTADIATREAIEAMTGRVRDETARLSKPVVNAARRAGRVEGRLEGALADQGDYVARGLRSAKADASKPAQPRDIMEAQSRPARERRQRVTRRDYDVARARREQKRAEQRVLSAQNRRARLLAQTADDVMSMPARLRPAAVAARTMIDLFDDFLDDPTIGPMVHRELTSLPADIADFQNRFGAEIEYRPGGKHLFPSHGAGGRTSAKNTLRSEHLRETVQTDFNPDYTRHAYMRDIASYFKNRTINQLLEQRHIRSALDHLGDEAHDWQPSTIADEMRERGYVPFDPLNAMGDPVPSGKIGTDQPAPKVGPDTLFIEKGLLNSLETYFGPASKMERWAQKWIDAPTRVWKGGVLALMPRWHTNNILGNMLQITITGGVDPAKLPGLTREARARTRAWLDGDFSQIPEEFGVGGSFEGDQAVHRLQGIEFDDARTAEQRATRDARLRENQGGRLRRSSKDRVPQDAEFAGTRDQTLREYLDRGVRPVKQPGRLRTNLERTVDWSYAKNEYVDTIAREIVYLDGKNNKGMSHEEAVRHALRTVGDFTNMTAFERRAVRRVVPFYAWLRHMTKVSMRLPVEHPARVAWMLSLSETYLPEEYAGQDVPFLGGAIPLGGDRFLPIDSFSPYSGTLPAELIGSLDSPGDLAAAPLNFAMSNVTPLLEFPAEVGFGQTFDQTGIRDLRWPYGQAGKDDYGRDTSRSLLSAAFEGDVGPLFQRATNLNPYARFVRDQTRAFTDGGVLRSELGTPYRRGAANATIPSGQNRLTPLTSMFGFRLPSEVDVEEQRARILERMSS